VNLTEIIENLPDKPILNIQKSDENNKYDLFFDKENQEQQAVVIDDMSLINDKSQLLDIQVELNRLKYAQIRQRLSEKNRDVTNQLKQNSWRPESERIKIANNRELNVLNNAKAILYQWFLSEQIDSELLTCALEIQLPKVKQKRDLKDLSKEHIIESKTDKVIFKKEGSLVYVTHNDRTKYYKQDGFRYLHTLFSTPQEKIHSTKLYHLTHYQSLDSQQNMIKDDINYGESNYYAIDDENRKRYGKEIKRLEEKMEEANINGNEKLFEKYRAEIENIEKHLHKQFDKKGRPRKLSSESEKNRVNVQRLIKRALDKIEREFPDIYESVNSTIETGTYCFYTPNDKLDITAL